MKTLREKQSESGDSDDEDEKESVQSSAPSAVNLFDLPVDQPHTESSMPKMSLGRRLSWTSVSTGGLSEPLYLVAKEDKRTAEKFRILLRPPQFDRDDLLCSVHNFISALADYVPSIRHDKTFTVFKSIRSFLSSAESTRLFGLLIHFTYWNVIHPTARSTMRALQELEDIKLFANIDVTAYDTETRLHLPKAFSDIDEKEKHRTAMNFDQIDAMFHEHCTTLPKDAGATKQPIVSFAAYPVDLLTTGMEGFSVGSLDSDASLTSMEKEQLFIQLESCIISLFRKMGRSKFALVTGRQALISCCHLVVDEVLAMLYPWLASVDNDSSDDEDDRKADKNMRSRGPLPSPHSPHHLHERDRTMLAKRINEVDLRLRRLIHQSISDLIDPSRMYTSTMLLNALLGYDSSTGIKNVAKKAKTVSSNDGPGKYYRTSASIMAIMGDSRSHQARKFLQRSGKLYTPLPGVVKTFVSRLDEQQQPSSSMNPRTLLHKIMQTESTKIAEIEHRRRNPKPLDFNHLFENQPEANYFPAPVEEPPFLAETLPPLQSAPSRGREHGGALSSPPFSRRRTVRSRSPIRVQETVDLQSAADTLTLNSDGPSLVANSLADIPISLKAKAALMHLMVEKTTKLYSAGVQTDQTAMKMAMIRGTDEGGRMKKR